MSLTPSSPVVGATLSVLTNPTYTLAGDSAPVPYGKQFAVTTLGGTQTGVAVSNVTAPFTSTFFKPPVFKQQKIDADGRVMSVPMNVFKQVTRKGVKIDTAGNYRTMLITTTYEVPSGSTQLDPVSVAAALSMHIGLMNDQAENIRLLVVNGLF